MNLKRARRSRQPPALRQDLSAMNRLSPLRHFLRRRWRHGFWLGPLAGALVLAGCYRFVGRAGGGRIYDSIDQLPATPVALVLGTAKYAGTDENLFYRARIRAAAALFAAGKVRGLLVSGDNAHQSYNEPRTMRQDLIAAGVPAQYITLDYAGFRTLDSVVRAREVFGQEEVVIVSQRFHVERALFLARRRGLRAVGFAAEDAPSDWTLRMQAREVGARALAVADTLVLGRTPRFLGKKEMVALRPEAE